MRDNYVGDLGDFFKYGLLRSLCASNLKLGVVWYLFPDKEQNLHGENTSYLGKSERYQTCDRDLFDKLSQIVSTSRKVTAIRKSNIFPPSTCFYESPLSFELHSHFLKRRKHRQQWFLGALEAIKDCDVVFLDPDTGLEIKSTNPYHDPQGPKYISYNELSVFIERQQTLVIYQHKLREAAETTIQKRCEEFKWYLGYKGKIRAYYFSEGSSRMFFVLPSKQHHSIVQERLEAYESSAWQGFFTAYYH